MRVRFYHHRWSASAGVETVKGVVTLLLCAVVAWWPVEVIHGPARWVVAAVWWVMLAAFLCVRLLSVLDRARPRVRNFPDDDQ